MTETTFKTPKGTTLPLMKLKGKDYLQVAYRIQWFREEKPDWGIATYCEEQDQAHAIMRADISNSEGRIIAVARKQEHKIHFADFLEKAETGAIGRALAILGYGTQFALAELDEGDDVKGEKRVADAPLKKIEPVPPTKEEPKQPKTVRDWFHYYGYNDEAEIARIDADLRQKGSTSSDIIAWLQNKESR